jgi:hypothetical protein
MEVNGFVKPKEEKKSLQVEKKVVWIETSSKNMVQKGKYLFMVEGNHLEQFRYNHYFFHDNGKKSNSSYVSMTC